MSSILLRSYGTISPDKLDAKSYTVHVGPDALKVGTVYLIKNKTKPTYDEIGLFVGTLDGNTSGTKSFALPGMFGDYTKWFSISKSFLENYVFFRQEDAWNRRRHALAAFQKANDKWKKSTSAGGAASGGYRKTFHKRNKPQKRTLTRSYNRRHRK